MSDRTAVAIILAMWLLSTLLWLRPGIVVPDGAGYYVYLPSAIVGHDLLFFDEWQRFGLVRNGRILHKEVTLTDHLGDHWTAGSAVWWLPGFELADGVRSLGPLRRFARDGLSLPYNLAVVVASAVAGLGVLLAGWSLSRSLAAVTGIWLGSPLLWYSLRESTMSHAVSAFACALLLVTALRLRKTIDPASLFAAGLAAGFAGAVRPQNLALAILPLFFIDRGSLRLAARRSWALACGALLGILPELIVSTFIYGNPIAFLYGGTAKPFAAFERVWIWEPLFSWYHGLVPWTPFLGIGVAGFFFLFRDDRRLGAAAMYAFVSQWAVNATLERSFWGAESFGQRRFDNCLIFFLIGAAAVLRRLPRWLAAAVTAVCAVWTLSIFFAAMDGMSLSDYFTPAELLRNQIAGLRDAAKFLRPLEAVPPAARAVTAMILLILFAAWAAAILALRRLPARSIVAAAAAVVIGASIVFLTAGLNDGAHLPRFAALIEHNRPYQALPGGPDVRFGLMDDEINYLRKSGRADEARKSEQELQRMIEERRSAAARLGIHE